MMKKTIDWKEAFQKLAALPIFKSHFAWGPLNAFVLLAGIGVIAEASLTYLLGLTWLLVIAALTFVYLLLPRRD